MAEITAQSVKALRDKTGAGMMDCKNALAATHGDMEAAVDWLRAKGLAKAAKKASRVAAEGLIGIAGEGKAAAVVEVNSETDFVARNELFQAMVSDIARAALAAEGDVERLNAMNYPGTDKSIADYVTDMVARIGENMSVRRTAYLAVGNGVVANYVHNQVAPGLGKIGVLVALESAGKASVLASFGRQLAMHVAAANPIALDLAGVPQDVLEREKAILAEKNQGKPDHVLEKIFQSGLKTFAKEHCLLDQVFVITGTDTVAAAVKKAEGEAGAPIAIAGFVRYQLGEGIERSEDDFAAEVARATAGA
jgi:elongation factor Ts